MYDTIHLRIQSPAPYIAYKDGRLPLQSVGSTASGGVFGALRNARVAITPQHATFKGSISKFYTNSEAQPELSREQIAYALSAIALLFDVEECQMQVTRLDVAFDLAMQGMPFEYMGLMLAPPNFNPAKWEGETLYFTGKKGSEREGVQLCIYDKNKELNGKRQYSESLNLLRLELRFIDLTKVAGQAMYADMLYNPQVWENVFAWWRSCFYYIPMMKKIQGLEIKGPSDIEAMLYADKIARGEDGAILQAIEAIPDRRMKHKAREKYEKVRQRFEIVESEQEKEYKTSVTETVTLRTSVTELVTPLFIANVKISANRRKV